MRRRRAVIAAFVIATSASSMLSATGWAQLAEDRTAKSGAPASPSNPPASFQPEPEPVDAQPDVWIFSGALQNSHEMFSGTLVASKKDTQFELKLAGGATCDGSQVAGDVGPVRLSEITCSDDRTMRALFVPQGVTELKVFGHVGDERFTASAHLLGTEPLSEPKRPAKLEAPRLQSRPDSAMPKPTDELKPR